MKSIDEISGDVIDVAIRLHRDLGPGLLESVYEALLAARLARHGYDVQRQRAIDLTFEAWRLRRRFGSTSSSMRGSSSKSNPSSS